MARGGKSGPRGGVRTTPNPKGSGWVNQRNGEGDQPAAPDQGKRAGRWRGQAKQQNDEHAIHGRDGTIQELNSYGNDPERRKG